MIAIHLRDQRFDSFDKPAMKATTIEKKYAIKVNLMVTRVHRKSAGKNSLNPAKLATRRPIKKLRIIIR